VLLGTVDVGEQEEGCVEDGAVLVGTEVGLDVGMQLDGLDDEGAVLVGRTVDGE
jgi:hypothetical protein